MSSYEYVDDFFADSDSVTGKPKNDKNHEDVDDDDDDDNEMLSPREEINGDKEDSLQLSENGGSDKEQEAESDDNDDVPLMFSSSKTENIKPRQNGKVDMTPPEQLLRKAKKKAIRYQESKKSERAIRELTRCTALVHIVYGDKHWKFAEAHTKLATGYFDLKGYTAQVAYHTNIAESVVDKFVRVSDDTENSERIYNMFIEMYYTWGRALTADKKLTEAEAALSKAEKMFQKFSKISSISQDDVECWDIKLTLALARLSFKQRKQAVSTMHYEKAIKLTISQKGADSIDLISIYQSLGKVEQSKGELADHSKAIEYYLHAHSIASSQYAEGSVEIADTSYALAQAYTNAMDPYADNSAERYFGDALSVYQNIYGASHEKTLAVQDEIARLMIRTDRIEEGVALLQSTVPAKQECYGDLSAGVGEAWKTIGSCYQSTGNSERALRALKKCLTVEVAVYGEKNKKTKETQKTIDMLLANPSVSGNLKKSKADELKERPRFATIAKTAAQLGGFKPQTAFY